MRGRRRLAMRFLAVLSGAACLAGAVEAWGGETMDRQEIRQHLEAHLRVLSVELGDRSIFLPENLKAAQDYVSRNFTAMGYALRRQTFRYQGLEVSNLIVGEEDTQGYYILGAHYDTVEGTPGADDNASGVAVLLEVARLARKLTPPKPWAFIAFTCEEPPAFGTPAMGSRIYAQQARRQQARILGMLCLEMVGYYSKTPNSQSLPLSLKFMGYPTTGDFIGLVSDRPSRHLMERLEAAIKGGCQLPSVSLAVPFGGQLLPEVRLSDHANFWDVGYPALMLTDTAFMRNPHYHGPGDTMDRLDLDAMTELTLGLVNFMQQEGR